MSFYRTGKSERDDDDDMHVLLNKQWGFLSCYIFVISGNLKGKRLIDIGCGPTIYGIISASKCFEEIVMSDIADGNRREIEKWLRNEEGCFNWRPIIQFVCELEGRR